MIVSRTLLGSVGAGEEDYWVLELTPGTSLAATTQVGSDSAGNIVVGNDYGLGSSIFRALIAKITPAGAVSWSITTTNVTSGLGSRLGQPCFQFNGNIHLPLGYSLYALTSAGAKSSEQQNGSSFLPQDYRQDGDVLYACGFLAVANSTSVLMRFSSMSTPSSAAWQTGSTTTSGDLYNYLELSSSNVFVAGVTNNTNPFSTNPPYHVAKHAKSNGARLATRYSTDTKLNQLAVDSSENVYGVGSRSTASILAKLDSSLVEQWVKSVTSQTLTGIKCKGSYLYTLGSGKYLTRWDLSGGVDYQIEFDKPTFTFTLQNINLTPTGAVLLAGTVTNGATVCMILMKLPANGSITGTFGSYTFTSTSPTVTTPAASTTTTDPSTSTTPSVTFSSGGTGVTSYTVTPALQGL